MTDSRPGDLFQPGDLVNNTYRIESIVGRGGTSDVYKARSEISGRLMALKVLKSEFSNNDDYLLLLTREEAMREIRHDAVVRYADNNRTADGHVYLLIDYVEGPGLDKKLKEGPMTADDLLVICRRVAEGLQAAHEHGICHRDLSPDNIILRDGDPAQAVIIDFGIAKDTNPGAETIVGNEFAGKYAYAAPEQMAGNTDERTDLYSLGALLLANFRGKSPNVGSNPMEVVQKKAEALDTSGVPEPLKAILDKLTNPDPTLRFQSAGEVLAALDGAPISSDSVDELSDATVIAPAVKAPPKVAPKPEPAAKPAAKKQRTPEPKKSSSKMLLPILGVGVVVLGLAGAFMSGVFNSEPALPVADPYRLSIAKAKDAGPRAVGFVPSEEIAETLRQQITGQDGTVDLTLATGAIAETWGADMLAVVDTVDELDVWRVSLSGDAVEIEGSTTQKPLYQAIQAAFGNGVLGSLNGTPDITLEEVILAPQRIEEILATLADCGPLFLVDPPLAGYGPDATITVRGTLSSTESRANLVNTIQGIAGSRQVRVDTNTLNATLCLIESVLPRAPSSAIDVEFSQGDANNTPNPSGEFVVGENPVIDVVLPADTTDGYLSVSVLDVSGNVFHLLPNINRQGNSVSELRNGQDGPMSVRVAFPIAQARSSGELAFRVDESTLGKTKILAIHSSEPLFTEMRPTSESAMSYSEALLDEARNASSRIYSLDSRILETTAR